MTCDLCGENSAALRVIIKRSVCRKCLDVIRTAIGTEVLEERVAQLEEAVWHLEKRDETREIKERR